MSVFFKWFRSLFQKELQIERTIIETRTRHLVIQERDEIRREVREMELQYFIGKPVFYFSNEVEDSIVGFGKSVIYLTQSQEPTLVVKDYVSGTDKFFFGTPWLFEERIFNALYTLDRNTLIAIMYRSHSSEYAFRKQPLDANPMTLPVMMRHLYQQGFYRDLEAYRFEQQKIEALEQLDNMGTTQAVN